MRPTERAERVEMTGLRDQHGPFFGDFGGRYMPESLIAAIDELTAEYEAAKADPAFQAEFESLLHCTPGAPRRSPRCRDSPSTPVARASSSSVRTSITPDRTRSTT